MRARARKQTPTILRLNLSFRSRLSASASTDMRQRSVAPDVTSMRLSIPKPTSETLPATTPAAIPMRPSKLFHAIPRDGEIFHSLSAMGNSLARNRQLTHGRKACESSTFYPAAEGGSLSTPQNLCWVLRSQSARLTHPSQGWCMSRAHGSQHVYFQSTPM